MRVWLNRIFVLLVVILSAAACGNGEEDNGDNKPAENAQALTPTPTSGFPLDNGGPPVTLSVVEPVTPPFLLTPNTVPQGTFGPPAIGSAPAATLDNSAVPPDSEDIPPAVVTIIPPTVDPNDAPPFPLGTPPNVLSTLEACTTAVEVIAPVLPVAAPLKVKVNADYAMTWTLKNSGTCVWDSAYAFGQYFHPGNAFETAMFTFAEPIAAGETVTITLTLTPKDDLAVGQAFEGRFRMEAPTRFFYGEELIVAFLVE